MEVIIGVTEENLGVFGLSVAKMRHLALRSEVLFSFVSGMFKSKFEFFQLKRSQFVLGFTLFFDLFKFELTWLRIRNLVRGFVCIGRFKIETVWLVTDPSLLHDLLLGSITALFLQKLRCKG